MKLLHDVYDKDENLPVNLKKAYQLTYKSLHPVDNKQSVSLALSIFNATTSAAIESYYSVHYDASGFPKRINFWWTISNSKQRYNKNFRIDDADVEGNKKAFALASICRLVGKMTSFTRSESTKVYSS